MEILGMIFFWLANIADWYTTKRLILDKKVSKELNPIINFMIEKVGTKEIDLKFQKMSRAEAALLLLKIIYGVCLHFAGVGFWLMGGILAGVAISNKWNLLGKLIRKIKELLGR